MLEPKNIFKIMQANKKNIKQFGIKKIGLFGSYIHRKPKKNSDIDIIVQFNKKQKTFDNYMNLKFCLEDLFRKKIDLVIYEAIKPELKKYILKSVKYAKGL